MSIANLNTALSLLGRFFDTHQSPQSVYPDHPHKPPYRNTPISQPFPRISPEEAGISSAHIASFLRDIKADETLNMHSILVLRSGNILAEACFGEQELRYWKATFSACKSITALAIGLLYDEGKLSPDEHLADIFAARIPPLTRLAIKDLRIRHLLTMSSGASFNEALMLTERDWIKGYFSGTFAPGSFSYNSMNTYVLSAIVREKSGEGMSEYLRPRLFDPLGIRDIYWETCPLGIERGGWGLYIRPEDMAKIGQLVLDGGVWRGRRILSQKWLDLATARQISTGNVSDLYDYGYQIWCGRDTNTFLFNGLLGQNVMGFCDNGVLLVSNAGNDEIFQTSSYFRLAEKYFSSPFPDSLPPDAASAKVLTETVDSLREKPLLSKKTPRRVFFRRRETAPPALPPECALLSGTRYTAADDNAPSVGLLPVIWQVVENLNTSGFRSLSFWANEETFYMTYTEEKESYLIPIGFREARETTLTFATVPYQVKVLGAFVQDEDGVPILKIRLSFPETPLTRYIKLYYASAAPHMKQYERPGGAFIVSKVLALKKDWQSAPLIGTPLSHIDDDYLRYRIEKKFVPDIRLKRENGEATPTLKGTTK